MLLTTIVLLIVDFHFSHAQFLSYDAIRMRVPGRCVEGDYDCGLGQCVPIQQFRDGKPDCMDGSDEWCFIGQVSCGAVYCADYKDMLPCLVNPKCDGSSKQLPWCSVSKEKLCADKTSFPCKGYGECVLWEWLLDGKKDCIDGSDEDEKYVLPLESAFRLAKNKTGLVLSQPIAPPPEDHPSLYVQGCSFCPHGQDGHTTPKNPFGAHTKAPLTDFAVFPTSTYGESDSIRIHRLTTPVIDEFFVSATTPMTPSKIPPVQPNVIFVPVTTSQSSGKDLENIGSFFPPVVEQPEHISTSPKIPMITPIGAIFKPVHPQSTNFPSLIPQTIDEAVSKSIQPSGNYEQHIHPDEIYSTPNSGAIMKPYRPTSTSSSTSTSDSMHQGTDPLVVFKPGPSTTEELDHNILTQPINPDKLHLPETDSSYFENTEQQTGSHAIFKPVGSSSTWGSISPEPSHLIPMIQPVESGFRPHPDFVAPSSLPSESSFKPVSTPMFPKTAKPAGVYPNFVVPSSLPSESSFKPISTPMFPETAKPAGIYPNVVLPSSLPSESSFKPISTPLLPKSPNPQEDILKPSPSSTKQIETYESGYRPMEHIPWSSESGTIQPSGAVFRPSAPISSTENIGEFFRPTSSETDLIGKENSGPVPPSVIHITENGHISESDGHYFGEENTASTRQRGSSPGYTPIPYTPGKEVAEVSKLLPNSGNLIPTQSLPTSFITTESSTLSEDKNEEGWIEETTKESSTEHVTETTMEYSSTQTTSSCSIEKREDDILCECEHGQMKNKITGDCEETSGVIQIKVSMSEVCKDADFEDSQQFLHNQISSKYDVCVQRDPLSDDSLVASIVCDTCSLNDINRILHPTRLKAEGLGNDLCESSDYNKCDMNAECKIGLEGVRYTCQCKPGTKDISDGYGWHCEGLPDDSQCILVFGICLIVWLMFLFGVFMLTCLCCIAAYSLFPKLCSRHIRIHPENADGLRTVVIGKNLEKNAAPMPHMKAIFAESLKHSAKGSTSVASAFALADMRKKRVSKTPEMSQVIEEINENPPEYEIADITEKRKVSVAKSDSFVKMTDSQITETPILEKNSSSVSLVSAGTEPAPQLPNLPLSLPIPVTTNGNNNVTPPPTDNVSEKIKQPEVERPQSSHSIGVQPTIWETYRVLGQQYSKSDLNERKPSLDSLELMFEARLAETHRTESSPPITFTAKQTLEVPTTPQPIVAQQEEPTSVKVEEVIEETIPVPVVSPAPPVNVEQVEQVKQEVKETIDLKQEEVDQKVAEMIGVSSYHPTPSPQLVLTKEEENIAEPIEDDILDKSLETTLLIEMAKQGIELPLSPKTPVPTLDELEKTLAEQRMKEDSEEQKVIEAINKQIETRRSSTSQKKSKIPSRKSSVSSISSNSSKPKKPVIQTPKSQRFIPKGLQRSREVAEDSDPEVAFFKRLEAMREEVDKHLPFLPPPRKGLKRRIPERTLSSISEKSAEILTDPEALDMSISCPATTRSLLDPKTPKARYIFKRKLVEVSGETSDVDIPRVSTGSKQKPIVSSPDIPDVTRQRSMEHLNKDIDISPPFAKNVKAKDSKMKQQLFEKNRRPIPVHPSSVTSSRMSSRAVTPRTIGEDSTSQTSRSTRHSVISRKIAHRKHELKSISGSAHDLSKKLPRISTSIKTSKSVGDLSTRPAWNISQHRTMRSQLAEFLPPITAIRTSRTAGNSPQPRARRSDSHFSLTSLPAAHSPISFWSSPHFNPSEDSRKPPKEDLWWNPNKS